MDCDLDVSGDVIGVLEWEIRGQDRRFHADARSLTMVCASRILGFFFFVHGPGLHCSLHIIIPLAPEHY